MLSDDNNFSLVVDATDGGYILTGFAPSSSEDNEWAPSAFAENPGEVSASEEHVVTVNSLDSENDERVWLSCILLNEPMSERAMERRAAQGGHVVRFRFSADGPIQVWSNELEHQGVIANDLSSSIELEG